MKSGLAVIGVCLVISGIMAFAMKRQMQTELVGCQDLVLGLIFYMEKHDGALPESEAAFRAEPYVVELPEGGVRIESPAETVYPSRPHGYPIPDLKVYKVAWGRALDDLEVDKYMRVCDAEGNKVELASWPSSPPSGKGYSVILLGASREIQARQAEGAGSDVHSADAPE